MYKTFKLKKNDQVYVVFEDTRRQGFYATVKSVGSKYVIVEGLPVGENRFDITTFLSVDSPKGYNCKAQLFQDESSYVEALAEVKAANKLYSDICHRLRKANAAALRAISATMYKINL